MVIRILTNLLILVAVVYTAWYVLIGATANPAFSGEWSRSYVFFMLNSAPALIGAGILHQLTLLALARFDWPRARLRVAALATSPIVLAAGIVIGRAWALIPGVFLYALLLRLPLDRARSAKVPSAESAT